MPKRGGKGKGSKGAIRKANKKRGGPTLIDMPELELDDIYAIITSIQGNHIDCKTEDGSNYLCMIRTRKDRLKVGQLIAIKELNMGRGETKLGTKKNGIISITFDNNEFHILYESGKVKWNPDTGEIGDNNDLYFIAEPTINEKNNNDNNDIDIDIDLDDI